MFLNKFFLTAFSNKIPRKWLGGIPEKTPRRISGRTPTAMSEETREIFVEENPLEINVRTSGKNAELELIRVSLKELLENSLIDS